MPRLAPALPCPCEVCRTWTAEGVCEPCRVRFAPAVLRCRQCALAWPGGAGPSGGACDTGGSGGPCDTCEACRADPPPWLRALAALDYAVPWDGLLAGLKFHGGAELAGTLSRLLVPVVRAAQPHLAKLVMPVPLSPARLAERGYNQAWELARRLAATLALPANATLLQRPVDTAHLPRLTRPERERSVRGGLHGRPGATHRAGRSSCGTRR